CVTRIGGGRGTRASRVLVSRRCWAAPLGFSSRAGGRRVQGGRPRDWGAQPEITGGCADPGVRPASVSADSWRCTPCPIAGRDGWWRDLGGPDIIAADQNSRSGTPQFELDRCSYIEMRSSGKKLWVAALCILLNHVASLAARQAAP